MSVAQNIEHYFAALERQAYRQQQASVALETLPFVTLSRQVGAGGRAVATALLQAMAVESDRQLFDGWQVLDRDTVETLQRHDGGRRVRTLVGEDYHSQIGEFVLGLFGREPPQDTALLRQSELMRSLAAFGRVIIVGHGAGQATKGLSAGLHLRLIAPTGARARRLASESQVVPAQANHQVEQSDRAQARLLKQHYRVDIDNPLLYDAVYNTDRLSADTIAAATIATIKRRASVSSAVLDTV